LGQKGYYQMKTKTKKQLNRLYMHERNIGKYIRFKNWTKGLDQRGLITGVNSEYNEGRFSILYKVKFPESNKEIDCIPSRVEVLNDD